MRVLVTGVTSPLGGEVCQQLRKQGAHVTSIHRSNQNSLVAELTDEAICIDLRSQSQIATIGGRFDALIHIASLSHGRTVDVFETTGMSCHYLVSRAIHLGIPNFVHISSMAVYGRVRDSVVSAGSHVHHQTIFGASKWIAECYLSEASRHIKAVSLRSPAIVGPVSHRHFLSVLLQQFMRQEPNVSVSNPDFRFNNIVHQSTFAKFIIHLIQVPPTCFTAVPLGSTDPIPLAEIISALVEATSYKGNINWVKSEQEPFSIDLSGALNLGFQPLTTKEALELWISQFQETE